MLADKCDEDLHHGRALDGLADFTIVQSYLSTAAKWSLTKLDALRELFTTGPWLPPAIAPP